jgi:hypothetical protein
MPLSAPRACKPLPESAARLHARLQCARLTASPGQSMTEYLVALAVLAAVIASAGLGDPPMLQFFLDSVRIGWARLLTALALPV